MLNIAASNVEGLMLIPMNNDKQMFLEKELSWLSFNHRVLQEAQDTSVPLLERFRFLGIYSSNMDEFYRVRVADVRRRVLLSDNRKNKDKALALFDKIQAKVVVLQAEFDQTYSELLTELSDNNVHLINVFQNQKKFYKILDMPSKLLSL